MTNYPLGTQDWQIHLEKARRFAGEYEGIDLNKPGVRFFRREYLNIASTYYYLALGLCIDKEQRTVIYQEKEGIEAKLKALENGR